MWLSFTSKQKQQASGTENASLFRVPVRNNGHVSVVFKIFYFCLTHSSGFFLNWHEEAHQMFLSF